MARARHGKIARLPAAIREQVNQRLHDGQSGTQIIAWLHEQAEVLSILDQHFGEEPISPQNLSEWRHGGYQEWLERREKVDAMKVLSGYAFRMAEAAGASVSDGAAAIAGGRILELLEEAEGEDLSALSISLAKLRDAEARLRTAKVNEAKLTQKERELELAELRFQRQTAELFLKWYKNKKIEDIAESRDGQEVKMEKLVQLMFGDRPE